MGLLKESTKATTIPLLRVVARIGFLGFQRSGRARFGIDLVFDKVGHFLPAEIVEFTLDEFSVDLDRTAGDERLRRLGEFEKPHFVDGIRTFEPGGLLRHAQHVAWGLSAVLHPAMPHAHIANHKAAELSDRLERG